MGNSIRAAERLGCVVLPMDSELGRHLGLSLRVDDVPIIRVARTSTSPDDEVLPSLGHLCSATIFSPSTGIFACPGLGRRPGQPCQPGFAGCRGTRRRVGGEDGAHPPHQLHNETSGDVTEGGADRSSVRLRSMEGR